MSVAQEHHLHPAHQGHGHRVDRERERVVEEVAEQRRRERQEGDESEVDEVEPDQPAVHRPSSENIWWWATQ